MFERPHHQRVARILQALDGAALARHGCLFGGGTAVALRFGEYRESVDIDLLVSNHDGYRALRELLVGPAGLGAILTLSTGVTQARELRADQYGLRTLLVVDGAEVKLEIIHEARIALEDPVPADQICGIPTLTTLDMATSKLLANSDRWADDGTFSRDVIDLAMIRPSAKLLQAAIAKAAGAYGTSVVAHLELAIDRLGTREHRLARCLQALRVSTPPAVVWARVKALRRRT